jgi:hypothetical protein
VDEDHNVCISLSVPAPTWFHFLSQLTDAICFVRTPVVVLASDGPVPAMNWSGDPVWPDAFPRYANALRRVLPRSGPCLLPAFSSCWCCPSPPWMRFTKRIGGASSSRSSSHEDQHTPKELGPLRPRSVARLVSAHQQGRAASRLDSVTLATGTLKRWVDLALASNPGRGSPAASAA